MGSGTPFGHGKTATWVHWSSEVNLYGPSQNCCASRAPASTSSPTSRGSGHHVAEEPQDLPRETDPVKIRIDQPIFPLCA